MNRRSLAALTSLLTLTAAIYGCSTTVITAPTPAPADAVASGDDASVPDAVPPVPALVSLKETKGSGNGLTVTWTDEATDLTGVELWRSSDGSAFAKVATGTGTSTFDATAKGMYTYCYKLKALRGEAASALSAEKCLMTGM